MSATVSGGSNSDAAAGRPGDRRRAVCRARGSARSLTTELAGKIVVDCVNPLGFDEQGPLPAAGASRVRGPGGAADPDRVDGGRRRSTTSARCCWTTPAVDHIAGDVLVLGEDREAVGEVCELATAIPGARGHLRGPAAQRRTGRGDDRQPDRDQPSLQSHAGAHGHGPAVTRAPRHTLHIVSGKGGTGKTTIAAAPGLRAGHPGSPGAAVRGGGPQRDRRAVRGARPDRRRGAADQPHSGRRRGATGWPSTPRTPCWSIWTPSTTSGWPGRPWTGSGRSTSPPRSPPACGTCC